VLKKIVQIFGSERLTADVLILREVAKELSGRLSFDFLLPCGAEYRDMLLDIGSRIIPFDAPGRVDFPQIMSFLRYFKENTPDAVHTHASFSGRVAARLAGVRICLSTRSYRKGVGPVKKKRLNSLFYNMFTTATFCHSSCLHDSLILEGIHRDRVFSVCPVSEEKRESPALPERIEGGDFVIACTLPFFSGFGHITLLRAFARLPQSFGARLIFFGEGPIKEECSLLASRLGIGGRVEFSGGVMPTKVYNTAPSIIVFPQEESWEIPVDFVFGASPTAALLASDIPENRELFCDWGEYFLPGDEFSLERAIRRLISDGDSYRRALLGAHSAKMPVGALVSEYERIYTALLSM